jgi:hypothetical protein
MGALKNEKLTEEAERLPCKKSGTEAPVLIATIKY